ncbi:hypothetical protein GOBAR_AA27340 [Gossypium barbadense]|uniref:Uncharacterized protein n=1 Tax=Gossypium barbadense TaxID=3634 RepID=A0A2P5WQK9_GOSBA|nr:hypothetical protein GOBAR_AA27340 [Gossypium barbadense]
MAENQILELSKIRKHEKNTNLNPISLSFSYSTYVIHFQSTHNKQAKNINKSDFIPGKACNFFEPKETTQDSLKQLILLTLWSSSMVGQPEVICWGRPSKAQWIISEDAITADAASLVHFAAKTFVKEVEINCASHGG